MTREVQISRYCDLIECDDEYGIYNLVNGCTVFLTRERVRRLGGSTLLDVTEEELEYLQEKKFFVTAAEVVAMIETNPVTARHASVTLSFGEACNLACDYCYQTPWPRTLQDSPQEQIDSVMIHLGALQEDFHKGELDSITINLIGGEPLLYRRRHLEFMARVRETLEEGFISHIKFTVDTNATRLDEAYIRIFPNLTVGVTLSSREDHNVHRSGSHAVVWENLRAIAPVFKEEPYTLVVRYNANRKNLGSLDDFVAELSRSLPEARISVHNTMTIDGAFVDYFSDDEYDMVFQDEIEPILERHGYSGPPAADDETPSRHCEVTSPGSRKFYANGIQTLCDAFAPLAENRVDSIRPLGTIGSICMTCHYLPACGGPKPCLPQPCSGLFPRRRRLKALIQKSVLNLSQDANLLPLSEG